jgi:hypothetical protein
MDADEAAVVCSQILAFQPTKLHLHPTFPHVHVGIVFVEE